MKTYAQACLFVLAMMAVPVAVAGDVEDLTAMLQEFLANSDERTAHERFWAEDLVYSSSAGLRFGKADILGGMEENAEPPPDAPLTEYSGEDVDIRLYDDMAVVAFRLVGRTAAEGGEEMAEYFNTGTFLKREGEWRVVAWQATRIPQEE